jgi:hypothetical protein
LSGSALLTASPRGICDRSPQIGTSDTFPSEAALRSALDGLCRFRRLGLQTVASGPSGALPGCTTTSPPSCAVRRCPTPPQARRRHSRRRSERFDNHHEESHIYLGTFYRIRSRLPLPGPRSPCRPRRALLAEDGRDHPRRSTNRAHWRQPPLEQPRENRLLPASRPSCRMAAVYAPRPSSTRKDEGRTGPLLVLNGGAQVRPRGVRQSRVGNGDFSGECHRVRDFSAHCHQTGDFPGDSHTTGDSSLGSHRTGDTPGEHHKAGPWRCYVREVEHLFSRR